MKHTEIDISNDEEVDSIIDSLKERLNEHDESRARVQDELGEICNKLREQLDTMESNINDRLKDSFEKEDAQAQEILSEIMRLTNLGEEKDDEQKEELAKLIMKAKAILLVKQSYKLRKPPKQLPSKFKFNLPGDNDDDDDDDDDDDGHVIFADGYNMHIKKEYNQMLEEVRKLLEDKDPDLSNLYELNIENELLMERLNVRKPEDLKIVRIKAGYVYLSFTKSFNEEEERVLFDHNLKEDIVYRAALCKVGSDEWTEYDITVNDDNGECFFMPQLLSDITFYVKISSEMKGIKSEWSECIEFTPSFTEFCGWKPCTKKDNQDKYLYSISEDNPMVVKSNSSINYGRICSTISFPLNKVTSCNFKVLNISRGYNNNFLIGVSYLLDEKKKRPLHDNMDIHYDDLDNESSGWFFDCNSSTLTETKHGFRNHLQQVNNVHWVNKSLNSGDTVGVVMDTTKGELSFIVNGVNYGVAYDGIPIDKPLVLCVIPGGKNAVELDLSEAKENANLSIHAPLNITMKDITWNSITLSWDAPNDGASFYQIETSENRSWYSLLENSFTFGRLSPDTEYCFRVRVIHENCAGEWSEVIKGRTTALPDFSECVWKKSSKKHQVLGRKGEGYLINKDNPKIVTCTGFEFLNNIIGNIILQPNKTTSWNINILSMQDSGDNDAGESCLFVGVAPFYRNKSIPHYIGGELNGWYFDCMSSNLRSGPPHNIYNKEYGPRKREGGYVRKGDTVGVVMNTMNGELSFVIDGVNLGAAYEDIPLDKPLAPSVILCNPGDSIELDTSEVKLSVVSGSVPRPKNIVVQSKSWNSISLVWDPVDRAEFYQVEVNRNEACNKALTNSYSSCNLAPGSEYTFRVRSVCGNEVSEWSDLITERTEDDYPDFSECIWRDVGKNTSYKLDDTDKRIVTKTSSGSILKLRGNIPIPLNKIVSWNIKVLKAQTTESSRNGLLIGISPYNINVNANENINENGGSYFYGISSFVQDKINNSIKIYDSRIRRSPRKFVHTGDTVGVVMDTINGKLSFVINGVNNGDIYEGIPLDKPFAPCVILMHQGDSVKLDLTSEVKENLDSSISVPQNIIVNDITWDSITLTWDKLEKVMFYQIEMDGTIQKPTGLNKATTRGLLPETEHNFRVRAVKEKSVGEWSDFVKVKTLKIPDFTECVWRECPDDNTTQGRYAVDQANPRVVVGTDDTHDESYVMGSAPLPLNKITSWNIKLLKTDVGKNISIGIASSSKDESFANVRGLFIRVFNLSIFNNFISRGYDKSCTPWKSNKGHIQEGDTVSVVVDTTKGRISFVVGGINLGAEGYEIPLDKPLVPCVGLYCGGNSVELDLSEVKENVDSSIPIPSNIAVKSTTRDSITLEWDTVDRSSIYQVEFDETIQEMTPTNTYTMKALLPDTEHTFRVRVVREKAVGKWSGFIKGRTQKAPNFSESVWEGCPDLLKKDYLIDEKNPRTITRISLSENRSFIEKYYSIIGNTPIPLNKITSWNIKLLKSLNNDGDNICIGVLQSDNDFSNVVNWKFNCYNSTISTNRINNAKVIYKAYGPRKENGKYVHTGDSIGVEVDTTKGEISFILNGVNLGVAYEGIPLDKPLVPCVTIGKKGDSVELIA